MEATALATVLIFFLCTGTSSNAENQTEAKYDKEINEQDDNFADSVLQELRRQVNNSKIEPISIGDVSFLTDGQFQGLSSIHRIDHTRRHDNNTLIIPAALEDIETTFNWSFSFLFKKSKGIAYVRAKQMPISLHIRTGPERLAQLQICDLPFMKGLTVQTVGAGNLNIITSQVASIALAMASSSLIRQLQDPVCQFVASVL